jgi:hypothetical protein
MVGRTMAKGSPDRRTMSSIIASAMKPGSSQGAGRPALASFRTSRVSIERRAAIVGEGRVLRSKSQSGRNLSHHTGVGWLQRTSDHARYHLFDNLGNFAVVKFTVNSPQNSYCNLCGNH